MRTNETTEERVKKIIAEDLCVEYDEVVDDALLQKTLGADSLDKVEIVMALENVFDISISDAEADSIVTVKDAVSLVEDKVRVQ